MRATELEPGIWNGIAEAIDRARPNREISFGKVVKRDTTRQVIWLEQYGDLAIPLAALDYRFEYYDTDNNGTVQKKSDPTGTNEAFLVKIVVPRVGETAVILDPGGQRRFPMCVGVIQSTDFWQGEG